MIFFDDEYDNIRDVNNLEVTCLETSEVNFEKLGLVLYRFANNNSNKSSLSNLAEFKEYYLNLCAKKRELDEK
jgi:hypothetical protein